MNKMSNLLCKKSNKFRINKDNKKKIEHKIFKNWKITTKMYKKDKILNNQVYIMFKKLKLHQWD